MGPAWRVVWHDTSIETTHLPLELTTVVLNDNFAVRC
jgi:hypothetical protein